jgi:crossover junction endodeoxyribonuclease RusA
MEFELPFPPSMNHLWRRVGARMLLSRGGRAFRQTVGAILAARGVRPLDGPLEIVIDVHPPDRRRRDLDNLQKALLDALAHGGAYHDDAQIARLSIERGDVVEGGRVRVWLRRLSTQAKPRTCLKCGKPFDSTGPGHRICPRCTRINAGLRVTEEELRSQRGRKRHNGEALADLANDQTSDGGR